MRLEVPSTEIKKRFPKQAKEVMDKLKSGKSKEKGRNPEELSWYFDWAVQIQAFSFADVLSGVATSKSLTLKEEAEETIGNIRCVSVYAEIGKWYGRADTLLEEVPDEIVSMYEETLLPKPIPSHLISLPKLRINNDGDILEHPILLGYKDKKSDRVKLLVDSDGTEILYELDDNNALWSGGLHRSFDERLKKAISGDIVKYRNKPFIKLSDKEIEDSSKKEYLLGMCM